MVLLIITDDGEIFECDYIKIKGGVISMYAEKELYKGNLSVNKVIAIRQR